VWALIGKKLKIENAFKCWAAVLNGSDICSRPADDRALYISLYI